ncbi:MAG: ATP-binding protein [Candidatus Binatia bacterium]
MTTQTTHTTLRFATSILRRLGEELNPTMDQGVLELIKNSYDADALSCSVSLRNVDAPGGALEVVDNGVGMVPDDIVSGWLVLGASEKEEQGQTALGRIPTGSKGLGRLACLRMGTRVEMVTRPGKQPQAQFSLDLDWKDFDTAATVEEVPLIIKQHPRGAKTTQGTRITVHNLKKPVTRQEVERLARAMILLSDPFGAKANGFRPELDAPEFKDLSALVEKRYFEQADYHIRAKLSGGTTSAAIVDWRGKELIAANHRTIAKKRVGDLYKAPDFEFDLWVFLLSAQAYSTRPVKLADVRAWLRQFGGVHVYENDLRVPPYGNPGNDWLELNVLRARSPEERPSTNNSIGRVRFTGKQTELVQKTDRSGYIESPAFAGVRIVIQDVLDWAAKQRLEEAEKRRAGERSDAPKAATTNKKKLAEALKKVPAKARAQVAHAIGAYDKSRDREIETLHREVELYRSLSTAGITAATFAHESTGNPLKAITIALKTIESRGKRELGERYESILAQAISVARRATESLSVLGTATLRLLEGSKRRVGRVDVHERLDSVLALFKPFLDGRQVDVKKTLAAGSPYLKGTEAAVESIVTILLTNIIDAI